MKIFYALTFEDEKKSEINSYKDIIANHALKGRFTREYNFHMTLSFIGEIKQEDLMLYEDIMASVDLKPMTLIGSHIGAFHKKNRDIIWLGLEKNHDLNACVKSLHQALLDHDLITEKRKYHPHITLGRQVLLDLNLSELIIPPIALPVKSFALMVSHRVHEQLIYESIAEILL